MDHPLCEECADTLVDLMDLQLKSTEDELRDYNEFLEKFQTRQTGTSENLEALGEKLEKLRSEEEYLLSEIDVLRQQEEAVSVELAAQEEKKQELQHKEKQYWKEYNQQRYDLIMIEDEIAAVEGELTYAQTQLDKLKQTNVFNATFHIWYSSHFGTINNLKLGRLPSAPVDWSEINAAWSQTALLLTALANKINFSFRKYRLVPYGNTSYFEIISEKRKLPLYGSGGFNSLFVSRFDAAMVAFLECLQQFKEEVERRDSGFSLPYRIDGANLEEHATGQSVSVKMQFNSDDQWTKALKFLLTNLKWSLAWVSSQFSEGGRDFTFGSTFERN